MVKKPANKVGKTAKPGASVEKNTNESENHPLILPIIAIKQAAKTRKIRYVTDPELKSKLVAAIRAAMAAGLSLSEISGGSGIAYSSLKNLVGDKANTSSSSESQVGDIRTRGIALYDEYANSIDRLDKAKTLLASDEFKLVQELIDEGNSLSTIGQLIDIAIRWSKVLTIK